MDRHTRKELKTDKFAEGVGSGFEFLSEHRGQAIRWGLIALAVVVIVGGIWLYRGHQATQRAELLAKAMQVDDATVGAPQPPRLNFPTAEDKEKARHRGVHRCGRQVPRKPGGCHRAARRGFRRRRIKARSTRRSRHSKTSWTRRRTRTTRWPNCRSPRSMHPRARATRPKSCSGNWSTTRPCSFPRNRPRWSSRKLIAKKNPAEARKLLEPLSASQRSAVSRAAVAAMGAIAANSAPAKSN